MNPTKFSSAKKAVDLSIVPSVDEIEKITKRVAEYVAHNPWEDLINDLVALGVTEDKLAVWLRLDVVSIGFSDTVLIHLRNDIRSSWRGTGIPPSLARTGKDIVKLAKKAAKEHRVNFAREVLSSAIKLHEKVFMSKHALVSPAQISGGYAGDFADDILNMLRGELSDLVETGEFAVVTNDHFKTAEEGTQGGWNWKHLIKCWNISIHRRIGVIDLLLSPQKVDDAKLGQHEWIVCGDMHFDAECPAGVKNLFNLPIFSRGLDEYRSGCAQTPQATQTPRISRSLSEDVSP